jgi:uncharacterized delta-60 repeat protein
MEHAGEKGGEMSRRGIGHPLLALILCAGLLAVLPGAPTCADLTPGQLDSGFDPGSVNGSVYAIALQPDGGVVIGGAFTTVQDAPRARIARLEADGTIDATFDPGGGANGTVYAVALQPDGKILIGGDFTMVQGTSRARVARLEADGTLDATFDPRGGASGTVYAIAATWGGEVVIGGDFTTVDGQARRYVARLNGDGSLDAGFDTANGPDGTVRALATWGDQVVIGGAFTAVEGKTWNRVARLNGDGTLDTGFATGTGPNDTVYALAVQGNGQIVIGGAFTAVGWRGRDRVARLQQDGTVDTAFADAPGPDGEVWALDVSGEGRVLIGGAFTAVGGAPRARIARLQDDGALDVAFDPGQGVDDEVCVLAADDAGKVVIGGDFAQVDGTSRARLARLNGDGSLDTAFVGQVDDGEVWDVALDPAGRIVIGGTFGRVSGTARDGVARLRANGTLDPAFVPDLVNHHVYAVAVQPDGKVVIGGAFTEIGATPRPYVARLEADGTLDLSFDPGEGANGAVLALALQEDGRIVIGGVFTAVGGTARHFVARLEANGTLDATFDPGLGANGQVRAVALQPDGKVLIGGDFTTFDGWPRDYVARLRSDGALDFAFDTSDGPDAPVHAVLARGGQVLIGGEFDWVGIRLRARVARLEADGALDASFDAQNANHTVYALGRAANGKIVAGGAFTQIGGARQTRVAQLELDGALDPAFDPGFGADGSVLALAVQPNGQVVIGGDFAWFDGKPENHLARLNGVPPLFEAVYLPVVVRE